MCIKNPGTSSSFKKFNISALLAAMLDDFICKKDEQAAGRRGKNEGKDTTREKQRKRERERHTKKEEKTLKVGEN